MQKNRHHSGRRSSNSMRAISNSIKAKEHIASKAFRLAATDHYGWEKVFNGMSTMNFIEAIRYLFMHLCLAILSAAITTSWILIVLFIGIPFLLTGHF